ncbi:MAG: hypothetical protein LBE12_15460 [Planctomycetaceae bacterium]|jgi:hypothetical protein|nr:hypothetical protein [Planctomycetaceae bacterium]
MYAKLSQQQRDLLSEYRENYIKLKNYYCNIFMSAEEKMSLFFRIENGEPFFLHQGSEPIPVYTKESEYRSNGGVYFRLDQIHRVHNESEPRIRLGLVVPDQSYLLRKNKIHEKYFSIVAKRDKQSVDELTIESSVFPFVAFSEGGLGLEFILFQKPFYASTCVIDDISVDDKEGIVIILVSATSKKGGDVKYRFVFLRNYFWVLNNIVVTMGDTVVTTHNQYQQLIKNSVPLLKSSLIETNSLDGKKYNFKIFEIKEIAPGAVPLQEFDIAQFLPPDVKIGITTPSFSYFRLFCLITGLLLLVLGIYLKIKTSRK